MSQDPLEALQACHRRIEEHLRLLEDLHRGADAQKALAYFDGPAALHHRDEDEDIFPLLRARAGALGRSEVAAAIDELEREHSTMEALWRRLREQLANVAAKAAGRLDGDDVIRFAWLYRRHMEREALLVLPFAREALSADELAALAQRMAARRAIA